MNNGTKRQKSTQKAFWDASKTLTEVLEQISAYVRLAGRTRDEDLIAEYETEIKKLKQQKTDLLGVTQQTNKYTKEQFGTATEKVFGTLKKPVTMWQSDNYSDKRTILLMYFNDQLQYDRNFGFGTASLAYPVKLIGEIADSKNSNVGQLSHGWNTLIESLLRIYNKLLQLGYASYE